MGAFYNLVVAGSDVRQNVNANIEGNLTVEAGALLRADGSPEDNLNVTGDVSVYGTLGRGNNELNTMDFGSLTIYSGGEYQATSAATTLTGDATDFINSGTFTHNNGDFVFYFVTSTDRDIYVNNTEFYNLTADGAGGAMGGSAQLRIQDSITVLNYLDTSANIINGINIWSDATVTMGNATQSGIIKNTGEFSLQRDGAKLYGASLAYPAIIQSEVDLVDGLAVSGREVFLKWVDIQQDVITQDLSNVIQLDGDCWFRNFTVDSSDTLNMTSDVTLYADVLDLSGTLTVSSGNITNNTNAQWLAQFDSATAYSWDNTNISRGNNTGAVVINAQTAVDGGNNVPDGMWLFGGAGVSCLFSANDTLTANLTCGTLGVALGATVVTGEYSINATGAAEFNGTMNASQGGDQLFGALNVNAGGTYEATSGATIITSCPNGGYCIRNTNGVFTHNSGTIDIQSGADFNEVCARETNEVIQLYNLNLTGGAECGIFIDTINVTNELYISSSSGLRTYYSNCDSASQDDNSLTVIGDVIVDGTLDAYCAIDEIQDHSFGSLTINSSGTYSATNGTTTITSESPDGNAILKVGTLTHNDGTIRISSNTTTWLKNFYTDSIYNIEITGSATDIGFTSSSSAGNDIFNNLIIYEGIFDISGYSLDVGGYAEINGTLEKASGELLVVGHTTIGDSGLIDATAYNPLTTFGSLTINSNGTYLATTGTTTMNGNLINHGTFTDNAGKITFAKNATIIGFDTQDFYNLTVSSPAYVTHKGNLTVTDGVNLDGTLDSKVAGGLEFNSDSNPYIDIGNAFNLGTSDFTISAWINKNKLDSKIIMSKGDGFTANEWSFGWGSNSAIFRTNNDYFYTPSIITANNWHHIVFVKDGNSGYAYVDAVSSGELDASIIGDLTNSESIYIGRRTYATDPR